MNVNIPRNLKVFLVYLLPLLLGLTFFYRLGYHSLWYDELETWNTVSQIKFSDFAWSVWFRHANPPLYYFLLWLINPFLEWNETSLRFLSAVSTLGTLLIGFKILKKYFGFILALGFSVLMATNYQILYFSQEARPYAFLMFLCALSFYYTLKIIEGEREKKDYTRLFLLSAAILLTHYYGSFFVFSTLVILLLNLNKFDKNAKIFFLASFTFFIASMILFSLRDYQKQFDFLKSFSYGDLSFFYNFLAEDRIINEILILFTGVFFLRLLKKGKNDKILKFLQVNFVLVGASIIEIFLISQIIPIFITRYVLFLFPFELMIFVGFIFLVFEEFFSVFDVTVKKLSQGGILLLIFGFLGWSSWKLTHDILQYDKIGKSYPYREAFLAIQNDPEYKKESFVILQDASENSFRFYAPKEMSNKLINFDPLSSSPDERIVALDLALFSDASASMYFLKVNYDSENNLASYMNQKDQNKKVIFVSDQISVIRFIKKN